jgi:hypothetical protein
MILATFFFLRTMVKTRSLCYPLLSWPLLGCDLGDDHMMVGMTMRGFGSNYFWACNPPQVSMCPPDETMVWIAACPRYFKLHAIPVPSMLRDHWSWDLDDTVWIDGSDLPLSNVWTRYVTPSSKTVIASQFWTLGFWNLKPFFFRTLNIRSWLSVDTYPTRSMVLIPLWVFDHLT